MKKITFMFSLLIIGLLFFQSCKKCATCTTTEITTSSDTSQSQYPEISKSTFELCGQDLKNVNTQKITTEYHGYSGGHTVLMTRTTQTECE